MTASCAVPDCERPAYARGHCERHYRQRLRRGALSPERREALACAARDCDRDAVTRGWCHGHYLRWLRTGDARPEEPLRGPGAPRCSVEDCDAPSHGRGLCRAHLARLDASGTVASHVAVRSPGRQGFVKHGYRYVGVPPELRHLVGGLTTALEHRLVMAVLLGRPLLAHEVVHHRNGDRLDNRPTNLELWSTSQPKGQRVTDKVAWAKQLLAWYEPGSLSGPENGGSPLSEDNGLPDA